MFAYDVNGDKLPDVVTSLFAHGPGLVWYEQQRSGQGPITWKMHMIMDRPDSTPEERKTWETSDKSMVFTELHAIALVDMDGDGVRDIVTGKRWFSHGMEYPENDRDDPAVLHDHVPGGVLGHRRVDGGDRTALDHGPHAGVPPDREAASRTASRIFS